MALTTKTKLVTIMTTFNRPEVTARCLASLEEAVKAARDIEVHVVIADASTDDRTRAALDPWASRVCILPVESDTYWAQGMRRAWEFASTMWPEADLLWLNDDVELRVDAFEQLRVGVEKHPRAILVGYTLSRKTREITYSGIRRGPWYSRLSLQPVGPNGDIECDGANGNFVYTPKHIDADLGCFPDGWIHGCADLDYLFRARRRGLSVIQLADPVGWCERNSDWRGGNQGLTLPQRWRRVTGPKGLPVLQWLRFTRRYGGIAAPLAFASPYARAILRPRTSKGA